MCLRLGLRLYQACSKWAHIGLTNSGRDWFT
jgi:hypothetical protein